MDKILEMNLFQGAYRNRRVLLTGHTGFKGSWLLCLLRRLGAIVRGIALEPDTDPSHFNLLFPDAENPPCDILDRIALQRVFGDFQPEIVFHLAAQPLVRRSYRDPAGTFETNVAGTVNVLECCRASSSVRAILVVTSDKCYENRETEHPYAETDPLGGYDPYSASKGCAEIAAACWRRSFFANGPFLATARAGNVIGGGDWAEDRLIPDMMRAAAANRTLEIRSPGSVRPWQHVLDCLGGYLLLGARLFKEGAPWAQAWNFGPNGAKMTVREIAALSAAEWDRIGFRAAAEKDAPHEAHTLCLDCSKAREKLHWRPVWDTETAVRKTVQWYRAFYENGILRTQDDLVSFLDDAAQQNPGWIR